jgi:hypothetical protein
MFLFLLAIVSIVAVLIFAQLNNKKKAGALLKVITGVCFAFSWVAIVMWFTSLVEVWQIGLNTPGANNESVPIWSRIVLSSLREVVYLLPASRLTLGVLYALPILLIPLASAAVKRSQVTLVLMLSTLVNLFFFWIQVIVDSGIPPSFMKVSIQGLVLLITYTLLIAALILQRSLSARIVQSITTTKGGGLK